MMVIFRMKSIRSVRSVASNSYSRCIYKKVVWNNEHFHKFNSKNVNNRTNESRNTTKRHELLLQQLLYIMWNCVKILAPLSKLFQS